MRILAGSFSTVEFTHLSRTALKSLSDTFTASIASLPFLDPTAPPQVLASYTLSSKTGPPAKAVTIGMARASCLEEGVMHLVEDRSCELTLDNVCLLDPKAEKELSPEDGDGRFKAFLFGVSLFRFQSV